MENILIQGFQKDRRRVISTNNDYFDHTTRGFMLDELQISAVLKSEADIIKMIDFLNNSIPCFIE